MLKKRIIPCLDIKDGQTVKGIHFENLRNAGDPIFLAKKYALEKADELVFLDITATVENRKTLVDLVKKISEEINIPFTVGGGIKEPKDVFTLLSAGADKISINSAAVHNPNLIAELAQEFGNQCVVVAVDTKFIENQWKVFVHGGRTPTSILTLDWVKQVEDLGAGEILLTSMNHDGTKNGFALEITEKVCATTNLPIIASGGCGKKEDFKDLFQHTQATGGLAASVFHFQEILIPELKLYLQENQIPIR